MRKTLGLAALAAVLACGANAQQVNIKIGVLSDMSSLYADIGGPGSVAAAKMAIEGKVAAQDIDTAALTARLRDQRAVIEWKNRG